MDKYNIEKKSKQCCENVDVKLLSLDECYHYSPSLLAQTKKWFNDKICSMQSNNVTDKTPFGGEVKLIINQNRSQVVNIRVVFGVEIRAKHGRIA